MALTIETFEVDVVVRRGRSAKRGQHPGRAVGGMPPLGPIAAAKNVPSTVNGDSRMSDSSVTSGKMPTTDKVLARAAPPMPITPAVPAPLPMVAEGMPRFISPPIYAPAPKPLPPAVAPALVHPATASGFKPMFNRLAPSARTTSADAQVLAPAGGAARPLDEATRRHMEGFFGTELTDVRVHADADAAALAKNLRAEALTIGRDIYFAKGKFDPTSSKGQALLAHELTHVLQQTKSTPRSVQRFSRGRSVDRFEAEAEEVGAAFSSRRDRVDADGLVVERYLATYATNRPATDSERVRLETLAVEALKTCSEIVRAKHPELLRDGRTLDRVAVDLDISLARGGDLEAGRAWGRRLAEALVAAASRKPDGTPAPSVAPASAAMASPDGGAPDPKDAGAPDQYVTFKTYRIARSPEQQRKDMEDLVATKGRKGPREWLDGAKLAYDTARPVAGVPANQPELEQARELLDGLADVVKKLEDDIEAFLKDFESAGRDVLAQTLNDSRTRAKAEGIKYGLTEKQIEETKMIKGEPVEFHRTSYDFKDPKSSAIAGIAEAARQLLQRRTNTIAPLEQKIFTLSTEQLKKTASPGGGPYTPPKSSEQIAAEKQLADEERSYDILANDLAQRYPVLGSFTKDKDDLSGLQALATGGTHNAAQLIGVQIADTLRKIKQVEDENKPNGDANPYKIPKIVALTKGRKSVAESSWQNKVVDEHVGDIQSTAAVIGIAIGLLQLALVLLAPATGGASLVLAAGLSTAVAVQHAKEYMLEEALAGSDVDKARALSQDEPSLFWLAVDIIAAAADIGTGAAAAAKLINSWRVSAAAVRAVEAAKTAEELAAAKKAMAAALEHEPELLARITKSIEKDGRLAKVSEEVKAVEGAVAKASEAELKAGADLASQGGHVHVTDSGRVFSCASPCTEMRAKYSELLASEEGKDLMGQLTKLEDDAAEAVAKNKKGAELKPLAERARTLDDALANAMTQARAKKIAGWLETAGFPVLKDHPLDVEAIKRIIGKTNPEHIKGQLLEELMGAKIQKMIQTKDPGLAALAGGRPIEKLEYVAGHRITDANGRQFTDGMLIVRDGKKVEVVAIFESKAGKSAAAGLGGEYTSLKPDGSYKTLAELGAERPIKELTDAELHLIEARQNAIEQFRKANPAKSKGMTMAQIDQAAELQGDLAKVMDKMIKTEAHQAVQDIERMVSVGMKIDDAGVTVAKGGRGSTKVVGVLPDDVPTKALEAKIGAGTEAKPGQGIDFSTQTVGIDSKDLNQLAGEIAARATAPGL